MKMKKLFLSLVLVLMMVIPASTITLSDTVLDAALDEIADNCETFFVSTDETYANRLGQVTLTEGCGNGDYNALANGETQGRALGITAQSITASGSGTAAYYGFYNSANTTVYYSNALVVSKAMTSGAEYEFSAMTYAITFEDIVSE